MNKKENINLDAMRHSGKILGEVLAHLVNDFIAPGITGLDVSRRAEEMIYSYKGAEPAFKGYKGFPEAACISINNQVVHGIPDTTKLKSGDILSIDCGVVFEGHFTDACRTVGIGDIGPREKKLLKVTKESLDKGIGAAIAGNHVGDISFAIQRYVERNRFSISLEFVGHGIGHVLHGPPCVPNYGPPGMGDLLQPGMCLAIEPVVFDGSTRAKVSEDGWTIYSEQSNLSAHFEDTVIVMAGTPEIITRR